MTGGVVQEDQREAEPRFAPDPITLVCLLASFVCGLAAWADLLLPALLASAGAPATAVVLRAETHGLARGAVEDAIAYRFQDAAGHEHDRTERVSSLAAFGMPAPGSKLGVRYLNAYPDLARLRGNETTGSAGWFLGAALIIGVAGLGNFRQWRFNPPG